MHTRSALIDRLTDLYDEYMDENETRPETSDDAARDIAELVPVIVTFLQE